MLSSISIWPAWRSHPFLGVLACVSVNLDMLTCFRVVGGEVLVLVLAGADPGADADADE